MLRIFYIISLISITVVNSFPLFRKRYWFSYREESELTGRARSSRQLIISGPAYGFSNYFKPVILEAFDGEVFNLARKYETREIPRVKEKLEKMWKMGAKIV